MSEREQQRGGIPDDAPTRPLKQVPTGPATVDANDARDIKVDAPDPQPRRPRMRIERDSEVLARARKAGQEGKHADATPAVNKPESGQPESGRPESRPSKPGQSGHQGARKRGLRERIRARKSTPDKAGSGGKAVSSSAGLTLAQGTGATIDLGEKIDEQRRDRKRRRWRWIAIILVCALFAGGLIWGLFFSPLLRYDVQKTSVNGGGTIIAPAAVKSVTGEYNGKSLLAFTPGAVAGRLNERLPWVQEATVTRDFFHGLKVDIKLRQPVAILPGGKTYLDRTGRVLPEAKLPDQTKAGLVPVTGVKTDAQRKAVATVITALTGELRAQTEAVDAANADLIVLRLRDGRSLKWGGPEESADKARVAELLITQPGPVYSVIDPRRPVTSRN